MLEYGLVDKPRRRLHPICWGQWINLTEVALFAGSGCNLAAVKLPLTFFIIFTIALLFSVNDESLKLVELFGAFVLSTHRAWLHAGVLINHMHCFDSMQADVLDGLASRYNLLTRHIFDFARLLLGSTPVCIASYPEPITVICDSAFMYCLPCDGIDKFKRPRIFMTARQ